MNQTQDELEAIPYELMEEPLPPPPPKLTGTLLTKSPRSSSFVLVLFTIALIGLISNFYWHNSFGLAKYLPAEKGLIFSSHQWWRIFTAIFIHGDIEHFLSNMFMLGIFTFLIYGYFGAILFPVISLSAAAAVNAISIFSYEPEVKLLGASGLVYFLGELWLILYFLIQRQHSITKRTLRSLGGALMIFWPTTFLPSTSYRTHLIGFVLGLVIGAIYFLKNRQQIQSHETYS